MPNVYTAEIVENTPIAGNIYSLTVSCVGLAVEAVAGQFAHIKCGSENLLRRPISVCDVDGDNVRFVFEVKGAGTKWLGEAEAGQKLNILGPLGKGFAMPSGDIIVIGGGIGAPPMLYAAKSAKGSVTAILGFQSKSSIILQKEFEAVCKQVIITTDDGSAGERGFVTAPLEKLLVGGSLGATGAVLSCGPFAMQKAVAELCERFEAPCHVSLEERMGCGVGACLVCACSIKGDEGELVGLHKSHVCSDGPVFDAATVEW